MPQTKPPSARKARLKCVLGRVAMFQNQSSNAFSRSMASSLFGGRAERHVLKRVGNERPCVGLGHMAGGAKISAWRDVGEHLPIAVHEMRDADHRRTRCLGVLPAMTIEAAIGPYGELIVVD